MIQEILRQQLAQDIAELADNHLEQAQAHQEIAVNLTNLLSIAPEDVRETDLHDEVVEVRDRHRMLYYDQLQKSMMTGRIAMLVQSDQCDEEMLRMIRDMFAQ